jgi:hypothetical protein
MWAVGYLTTVSGVEPGLDRHEWETLYEGLEPLLEDDPEEALPELAALVDRMLDESGLRPHDEIVFENTEPIAAFREAWELAERSRLGEDLPPGDVAHAIRLLRDIYFAVLQERRI